MTTSFSSLSKSLLLRKNLPSGVLDLHCIGTEYPKTLLLLVVGRVVDWVSLAQSVVHDGLSRKAAFVKVTHVMVGEEGPTNDGTVEWKGTMERFLNNHFEARLGSGKDVGSSTNGGHHNNHTTEFTGTLKSLASSQPRYVNVSRLEQTVAVWEFNGTLAKNVHLNCVVPCQWVAKEGSAEGSATTTTTTTKGNLLDGRIVGKFDRCCVNTKCPEVILPAIKHLLRPGGWLVVKYVGVVGAAMEEICTALQWTCHAVTTFLEVDERDDTKWTKVVEYLVVTPEQHKQGTLRLPSCPCCQ